MDDPGRVRRVTIRVIAILLAGTLAASCGDAGGVQADDAAARLAVAADVVDVRAGEVAAFGPGTVGQGLDTGDDVRTGQPGYAEVSFRDGSLTRVDAGSEFTVADLSDDVEAPRVTVDLDLGRAWNRVRTGTDLMVTTAVGTAAVRGTAFDVDCRDPAGVGCTVTVVEGTVTVAGDAGDSVDLVAVQRVTVAADGTLGEVVDLTLADARADAWIAGNLDADARRAFATLAAAGGDAGGVSTEPASFATVGVQQNQVGPVRGDLVRQHVVAGGPTTVEFAWDFCNPQICGTSENIVCVGGYGPRYGALQEVVIEPPEGHELVGASIGLGGNGAATDVVGTLTDDGWQGATSDFATPPERTSGGGIRLVLEANGLESTYRRLPEFPDQACAISEERRDEILTTFGPSIEVDVAAVAVDVVWRRVVTLAADAPAPIQVLQVGGGPQEVAFTAAPEPTALVADAPTFRQTDEAVAGQPVPVGPAPSDGASPDTMAFAEVGTVPTALANAFVRLGHDVTPGVIGERLLATGAWRPGAGTSFAVFAADGGLRFDALLDGVPQPAEPTALVDALDDLAAGDAVVLASLAEPARRSMVVLTSYDIAGDAVTALHPLRGEVSVTIAALAPQLTGLYLMRRAAGTP